MPVPEFHDEMNLRDILDPAMDIAQRGDALEAEEFVRRYAAYLSRRNPEWSDEQVIQTVHSNLGYGAGYYSHEAMEAVRRTFGSRHPIFG